MKKKSRLQKYQNVKNDKAQHTITRQDMDRMIFDLVMGEIYENSHINALPFDDILTKYKVELPENEKERVWDVLVNSMWVSPTMGFGQAGKLELTPQGFQIMSQYGTYSNYLASTMPPQPQRNINATDAQCNQPEETDKNDSAAKKKDE